MGGSISAHRNVFDPDYRERRMPGLSFIQLTIATGSRGHKPAIHQNKGNPAFWSGCRSPWFTRWARIGPVFVRDWYQGETVDLGDSRQPQGRHEPPLMLLEQLPPDARSVLDRLARAFAERSQTLYLVGGSVRDLLLGRPVKDLDFATSAEPRITEAAGRAAGATSVYTIGEKFGTIGFAFDSLNVEITTFREEHYPTATRHPEVQHGVDIVADLSRRDFTINAIAIEARTGEIIDRFQGLADLEHRLIRAVGEPEARFREDPLRILRAVRFAAELDFQIHPETLAAMRTMAPELERISRERIAAEFNRLLVAPAADHGLDLIRSLGLLPYTIPELIPIAKDTGEGRHKNIWTHTVRVVTQSPPRLPVRWAALLHDAAKPMTRSVDEFGQVHFFGHERLGADLTRRAFRRLKLDRALTERVAGLVEMHLRPAGYEPSWTDSAVRRLMLEAGELRDDLLALAAADVTSARAHRQREAAERIAALAGHIRRLEEQYALDQLKSPLDGDELMAIFHRPPGRWIGQLKDHLRELVIEGTLAPGDRETALEEAHRWMAEHGEA